MSKVPLKQSTLTVNAVVDLWEKILYLINYINRYRICLCSYKLSCIRTLSDHPFKVSLDSTIYTEGFNTYNGLVDLVIISTFVSNNNTINFKWSQSHNRIENIG